MYLSFSYGFLSTILSTYKASEDVTLLEVALPFWFVVTVGYCFGAYKALKKEIKKHD